MKTLYQAVAAILILGQSFAFAQVNQAEPHPNVAVSGIELKAPATCEIGELVRLDATGSDVDSLVWDVLPNTDDIAFDDPDKPLRAFFSSRSGGEYLFVLAGAKGGRAFLSYHRLVVQERIRDSPDSSPFSPTLKTKVGSWLNLAPDSIPNRAVKIRALATVFRKLAAKPVDPEDMVSSTALASSGVLGNHDPWVPFLDKLGAELDRMAEDGQLQTTEQYKRTWNQIADALDAHAQD